jgi:chemotaxis protein CheD
MQHTVGISEMYISQDSDEVIITYSLGSCIGITVFDPVVRIGGMIHCMLPLSKTDPAKAELKPAMFVDTGMTQLLETIFTMGGKRERLIVKIAGGASPLSDVTVFQIGVRNFTVARKLLWKNNILINREEVGGTISRTMSLYMDDGHTEIKSQGSVHEL